MNKMDLFESNNPSSKMNLFKSASSINTVEINELKACIEGDNLKGFTNWIWLEQQLDLLLNYDSKSIERPQDIMSEFEKLASLFYSNNILYRGVFTDLTLEEYLTEEQGKLTSCTTLGSVAYRFTDYEATGFNKYFLEVYDNEEAFAFGDFLNYIYEFSGTPYGLKKLINPFLDEHGVWGYLDEVKSIPLDELSDDIRNQILIHDNCCTVNSNKWIDGLEDNIANLINRIKNKELISGLKHDTPLGKAIYLIEKYAEQFEDRPIRVINYLEEKLKPYYSYTGKVYRGFRTPNRDLIRLYNLDKDELLSCTSNREIADIFSKTCATGSKLMNNIYLTGEVVGAFDFGKLLMDLSPEYGFDDEGEILVKIDDINDATIVTRNMEKEDICTQELNQSDWDNCKTINDKIKVAMLEYMGPRDLNPVIVDFVKYNSVQIEDTLYRGDCIHESRLKIGKRIRFYNTLASFTTELEVADKFANADMCPDFYRTEGEWCGIIPYPFKGLENDNLLPVIFECDNLTGLSTDRYTDRYQENEVIVYTDNLEFEIISIDGKYIKVKPLLCKDMRLRV